MKIIVDFDKIENEGSYYIFPSENIEEDNNFGDLITISKTDKLAEISDFIDVDNKEIIKFIKDNFRDFKAILGFMRGVTR